MILQYAVTAVFGVAALAALRTAWDVGRRVLLGGKIAISQG